DRFATQTFEGIKRQQEETTPLRRAGTPEDIAAAVACFCGEGSDHITGETLITDAGLHLGYAPFAAR
ncbi:MAG: SDR family oxidoreductase, partial [Parvibaculum sp.]|uniref:SDR family oxidoreductase n=1 Tax=Parvibaculum sp. TaxID=2024848 RepID=UPI0032ECFEE6